MQEHLVVIAITLDVNFESNLIYNDKKIGHFYVQNLAYILHTMTYDTGYAGYESLCHVIRRDRLSKDSYYNHVNFLHNLMHTFFHNNRDKVHQDIKEFHARNLYNIPNYEQNEYLELIVSIDGTYSHVGHNSSGGATFVCELFTGRIIDVEFTEKCFKCKDCDKYETNGTCMYGNFHGGERWRFTMP